MFQQPRRCLDIGRALALRRVIRYYHRSDLSWFAWSLPMRWRVAWLARCFVPCVAGVLALAPPARALQFEQVDVSATEVVLGGRGPIVEGDFARFQAALAELPHDRRLLAVAFDSPGGNLAEAAQMAETIHQLKLTVVIPASSKCASACFLLLAAADRRLAARDALIGVHSASENGIETESSMAMTTAMARAAAGFGVPAAIIGRMVDTRPGRVEWLTPADLASMGVEIFNDSNAPDAARRMAAGPPPQPASALPPALPPAGPPASAPAPAAIPAAPAAPPAAPVAGPAVPGPGLPSSSPSPVPVLPSASPAPAVVPAMARPAALTALFRGAFFCGDRPTSLSLRLLDRADGTPHRALLGFGPTSANPMAPSGSEIVDALVDLATGRLDVHVAAQAAATWPVGLVGSSRDGGRTFAGQVVGGRNCTMFTLQRVQ